MAEELKLVSETPKPENDDKAKHQLRTTTLNTIAGLNKVEGFYPEALMEKYPDKNDQNKKFSYLNVPYRVCWFNAAIKNGAIISNIEQFTQQYVCFKTTIYSERGNEKSIMSIGYALETFPEGYDRDIFAKAQTASVGRALALAGFGTANCGSELNEGGFADAPISENGEAKTEIAEDKQKEAELEKKWLEFNAEVQKQYENIDKEKAFSVMITFGPLKGTQIKKACLKANKKDSDIDIVANLRPYLNLTECPDICHARTVAACKKVIEEFDNKCKAAESDAAKANTEAENKANAEPAADANASAPVPADKK